jgi:two-component system, response regulator YesN
LVLNFDISWNNLRKQIEQNIKALKDNFSLNFYAGAGIIVNNPINLFESAEKAKSTYRYSFLKPSNTVFFHSDFSDMDDLLPHMNFSSFSNSLNSRNFKKLEEFFDDLSDKLIKYSYSFSSVDNIVFHLTGMINEKLLQNNLNNLDNDTLSFKNIYVEFYKRQNIFEAITWLKYFLINIMSLDSGDDEKNSIAIQIKDYIDKNYANADISLEMFSGMFFLSTSYISILFKQTFKIGISEYVSNIRLQKAKELLEQKFIKIEKIAKLVGMHNHSYFATKFKKHYCMSPQQYRIAFKSKSTNKD